MCVALATRTTLVARGDDGAVGALAPHAIPARAGGLALVGLRSAGSAGSDGNGEKKFFKHFALLSRTGCGGLRGSSTANAILTFLFI